MDTGVEEYLDVIVALAAQIKVQLNKPGNEKSIVLDNETLQTIDAWIHENVQHLEDSYGVNVRCICSSCSPNTKKINCKSDQSVNPYPTIITGAAGSNGPAASNLPCKNELTTICAWCKVILKDRGTDTVSHGVCNPCAEKINTNNFN